MIVLNRVKNFIFSRIEAKHSRRRQSRANENCLIRTNRNDGARIISMFLHFRVSTGTSHFFSFDFEFAGCSFFANFYSLATTDQSFATFRPRLPIIGALVNPRPRSSSFFPFFFTFSLALGLSLALWLPCVPAHNIVPPFKHWKGSFSQFFIYY